jgi:peptide/nickel transport system substrate-binding protein
VPAQSDARAGLTAGGGTAGRAYEHDLERARELLAEAGFPGRLLVDLITSEMAAYRSNYEVLQAELADDRDHDQPERRRPRDDARADPAGRQPDHPLRGLPAERRRLPDPLLLLAVDRGHGANPITNFSHYAAIDDLIEQARAETDPAAQEELWKQANIRILEDTAAMPAPLPEPGLRPQPRTSTTGTSWSPAWPSTRRSPS